MNQSCSALLWLRWFHDAGILPLVAFYIIVNGAGLWQLSGQK
jgi:hypothetical protein